jgi:ubiquinone/menaquinone biosynthesis C-methylase UbiE
LLYNDYDREEIMIPFQLHRRIPLVRRPFYQRDLAIAERDRLISERNALLSERDELRAKLSDVIAVDNHLRIIVARGSQRIVVEPEILDNFRFENGDRLSLVPETVGFQLKKTPDGQYHIGVGDKRYRIPEIYTLSPHKDYLFPEHLVVLTGAGTHTLEAFGRAHIENYRKFMGLSAGMTFLEIGCGIGRDALQLIDIIGPTGKYIGTDVTWDSINWCQQNISRKHSNFAFYHYDAKHELYNPLGTKTSLDFSLPADDQSVDRISAGSVFTHLFEREVVHYMKEFARVLKPGGLAYATFFLHSPETIGAAERTNLTHNNLLFKHLYSNGCFINDPTYPTGAVAFTDDAMQRMMKAADIDLACPYLKGAWSGLHDQPDDGQEAAILTARKQ